MMKQLGVRETLGICAGICLGGGLYGTWEGYGGRAFAATLTTFAILLLGMLLFAARGVAERLARSMGPTTSFLLGTCMFLTYLVYLLGTGTFAVPRAMVMAGFIFVPLGVAMAAHGAAPGAWQDFLVLAGLWVFVKLGPSHWLWPYPGGHLAYVSSVLMAVNVSLITFVLMRGTNGVGYSIGWGKGWGRYVTGSFLFFACIAIPLGLKMHFIAFAPQWGRWNTFAGLSIAILLFTAWPEEFLFRGLLQNLLSKASKSDVAGWWTSSVLFGLSHITNMGFPNWRYVILATLAGLLYGWTWKKSGSIFASALVHAAVDVTWHFMFRS
jgi:membrane protease YdiL (CAAX protease family)